LQQRQQKSAAKPTLHAQNTFFLSIRLALISQQLTEQQRKQLQRFSTHAWVAGERRTETYYNDV